MITSREVANAANEWQLRHDVVEKDYMLGWLLAGIANHPVTDRWAPEEERTEKTVSLKGRWVHVLTAGGMVVASALVAVTDPRASGAAPTSGCSLEPTAGTVARPLRDRTYDLNVPQDLPGPAVPLLLSLHGYGEPHGQHERETGWPAYAAAHGFIVAFPQGVDRRWDFAAGSPDVAWLREVVADVSAGWCVDPHRIYAEGYSNGAMMVERLACDIPDVIAAVAAYAGASPTGPDGGCAPSRPIAVGIFQSLFDPISSYPVGVANRDEWVSRNGCPANGSPEPGVLFEAIRYAPCRSGVEVVWRVYGAQSHNWPTGIDQTDIAERMWALFQRNPRPSPGWFNVPDALGDRMTIESGTGIQIWM